MNSIKFNSDFVENLIKENNRSILAVCECIEELSNTVSYLNDCTGFGIDEAKKILSDEINSMEKLYEELIDFKSASEKVMYVYESAENSVKRDLSNLPVLTHGNICSKADVNNVLCETDMSLCKTEIKETSAGRLLKSNTVMHEDWLLTLTAEKIMR